MGKKLYLFLIMMICMSSVIAQNPAMLSRVKKDKENTEKNNSRTKDALKNNRAVNPYHRDGDNAIVNTTILAEDFSKFTAGSEAEPDATRLDDPETSEIADTYFNTPGWFGLEVYQAGGSAYIKFSEEYGETGMLITPLINTAGPITIKCRMKSVNPEGDNIGYNIANGDDLEIYDSNIGYLANDEWTDVEWFTTYGGESTYIYLFSYTDPVYIDDIEIIHHYMPVPTILPETNVTENSFTANWEAIEGADEYNFFLYTEHTAATDETYNLYNLNFNDIESSGTEDAPEVPEEGDFVYNSWYSYLHVFINGALGISGEGTAYYDYSYISSPEMDLSSDDGKATLTVKLKAHAGDAMELFLYSAEKGGYYDVVYDEYFSAENDEWNEYTFELEGGTEFSIIELWYYGYGYLYIDDIKVTQNLKAGDIKSLLINDQLTTENSIDVVIDEAYKNDKTYYKLYGIKYIYAYDPYYDEYYMAGGITSDFTEPRYSPTNEVGVNDMEATSSASAYFNNGVLNVFNPDNDIVSVYNVNGVCLFNAQMNGSTQTDFAKGLYIVKVGDKVMKAVNN
ncbi:MAG: hypothetical protein E7067_03725 [Lentimicrobiaceae bacterium]|nr:hypothetical protein [Lentimicrobiaceae bacterium]